MISLIGPMLRFTRMPVPNFKFHHAALLGLSRRFLAKTVLFKAITVDFQEYTSSSSSIIRRAARGRKLIKVYHNQKYTREDACLNARSICLSSIPREICDLIVVVAVKCRDALQCCIIANACCCPDPQRSIQI